MIAVEPPLAGLYIHIPFCSAVCPYCDFAVEVRKPPTRARLVDALCEELRLRASDRWVFDTIYLGGGTPSILAGEELARLLATARECFRFATDTRLHFEANPEDVNDANLALWRELGVHMLSLGVQSFDDGELRFLGRRHSAAEAIASIESAQGAGFPVLSIDLIFGLPGQTPAVWRTNLAQAIALGPEHLSCYQLTVSEGTPFHKRREKGKLLELGDDAQGELFESTHEELARAGYAAYEVSNFARAPEHRSRHNRKYWQHVPYLGIGPSAHSFDGARRSWNERSVALYRKRIAKRELPVSGSEELCRADLATEALMLGLRTGEGIDLADFHARHGYELARNNRGTFERLRSAGFLADEPGRMRLTVRGLAIADSISAAISLE